MWQKLRETSWVNWARGEFKASWREGKMYVWKMYEKLKENCWPGMRKNNEMSNEEMEKESKKKHVNQEPGPHLQFASSGFLWGSENFFQEIDFIFLKVGFLCGFLNHSKILYVVQLESSRESSLISHWLIANFSSSYDWCRIIYRYMYLLDTALAPRLMCCSATNVIIITYEINLFGCSTFKIWPSSIQNHSSIQSPLQQLRNQ